MSGLFTCPEITISGTDSIQAPTTAVNALVDPGPDVTRATPRLFLDLE